MWGQEELEMEASVFYILFSGVTYYFSLDAIRHTNLGRMQEDNYTHVQIPERRYTVGPSWRLITVCGI